MKIALLIIIAVAVSIGATLMYTKSETGTGSSAPRENQSTQAPVGHGTTGDTLPSAVAAPAVALADAKPVNAPVLSHLTGWLWHRGSYGDDTVCNVRVQTVENGEEVTFELVSGDLDRRVPFDVTLEILMPGKGNTSTSKLRGSPLWITAIRQSDKPPIKPGARVYSVVVPQDVIDQHCRSPNLIWLGCANIYLSAEIVFLPGSRMTISEAEKLLRPTQSPAVQ